MPASARLGHDVGMTIDPHVLVATREALHALAEHVLAADLHRRTGRIGLRAAPGGFATPVVDGDASRRRVRVDGTDVAVDEAGEERRVAVTTLRAAAELVGIDAGGPRDVYPLATPLDLDAPLPVDADAAALLAAWFDLSDRALVRLAELRPHDDVTVTQLWPEHFDLARSMGQANYGGSPGDADHPRPYLYVGPWNPPPGDERWNEPFGASLAWHETLDVDEAVAFLVDGHDRWAEIMPPG
jgi:hypothetical protein